MISHIDFISIFFNLRTIESVSHTNFILTQFFSMICIMHSWLENIFYHYNKNI